MAALRRPSSAALAGSRLTQVGHFYVDAIRASVRVLLPLALVVGVLGLWQGVPMTFAGAVRATTLGGERHRRSPAAWSRPKSAIKQLGTNGGGYSARTPPTRSRTRRR